MPITLSNTRITVEFQAGDPKGNSWVNPFTLDDIVAASVAGSWNPAVTKQGMQYNIPYSLYIIGADTFFLAENSQVHFEFITGNVDGYKLYVTGNFKSQGGAHDMGMSWYNDYEYSRNSIWLGTNTSDTEIYVNNTEFADFRVFRAYARVGYPLTIENTKFKYVDLVYIPSSGYVNFKNIVFYKIGLVPFADFQSAENVQIIECGLFGLYIWTPPSLILRNVKIIDCTYDLRIRPTGPGQVANLYDSQVDLSSYTVLSYAIGDWTVNNISTFKINIEDGDGGTANLYDKDDNLIFSEVLSGELEQDVTFEKLEVVTIVGAVVSELLTTLEPFKLVVSKETFRDLIIPGIIINPGEQTRIFAKIVEPTYYQQSIAGTVSVAEIAAQISQSQIKGTVTVETDIGGNTAEKEVSGSVETMEVSGTKNN